MNRAALYLRLSKEDAEKTREGDDSGSIQNQRLLLLDYAKSRHYMVEDIYIDEDYSGMYEDRPEFERLIKNAKLGKFDLVLCKSQSRFTRNMQHSEKYLEELFPMLGIRFIGVVDGTDTEMSSNKKARQINGLVNDWYVEDLSNNIRQVFQKKMKAGQNLAAFPTYGYLKDPEDKYKLVIDPEAAETVRYIYSLCLEGYSIISITQILSEEKIATPTQYKINQKMNYVNPHSFYTEKGIWSATTVCRILKNKTYLGDLIQGREKKVSYKSRKIVTQPEEEWIVVKNHHEPIVSEEEFNQVQSLLKQRRRTSKTNEGKARACHLFSGKIKCMDCGSTMTKTSGRLAGGYDYFLCQLFKKTKTAQCSRHSIRYDILKDSIAEEIKKVISLCLSDQETLSDIKKYMKQCNREEAEYQRNRKEITKTEAKILWNQKAVSDLYLDKAKGILSEAEFLSLKKAIQENTASLLEKKKKLLQKNEKLKRIMKTSEDFGKQLENYGKALELSYEMVNDFISVIEIGETKEGMQEIRIYWNV